MVESALSEKFPDLQTERVIITTSGDWKPEDGEVRLSERAGGKVQFAKEIEEALLAGEIDCAVHSMKDMDTNLPDGLVIDHMLPREDVRDCLLFSNSLSENGRFSLDDIPQDSVVGTVSVRRGAFLLSQRPDLKITPFRGNVQTRIEKVRSGQVDMTMLAMAGLKRLGIESEADVVLEVEDMLPAAAQGAVGVEVRAGDEGSMSIFSRISDEETVFCVKAERAALRALDGTCHSPIGAYAVIDGDEMWLRVRVSSVDGVQNFEDEIRGQVKSIEDAQALGTEIGMRMKKVVPAGILK
jgi:hydroxymethylbilane synthase